MNIYRLELKKLYSSVTLWVLIILFLVFNIFLVISNSGDKYVDFIGEISHETGYVLNEDFYNKLSQVQANDIEADYLEQLQLDTYQVEDVFDEYNINEVGERYIEATGAPERFAKIMRNKYSDLQNVVNKKGESNEAMTLYFAGATYYMHQLLFKDLMGWLIVEGVLISALLILLSLGYENNNRTEGIVYSTKTGRNILRSKFAASISAALGGYLLLFTVTFLIYFSMNDYSGIWGSSVSSIFNYRNDIIAGVRPFVTWHSYSVFTYFLATIAMSIGLICSFILVAFIIGTIIQNSYISFFVFLIINALMIAIPLMIPNTTLFSYYIKYYSMLSPVWLWLKHSLWFTDGDTDTLWKYFETMGLCVSILALTAFSILAAARFKRRDII
ncbi:hypothetical protein [Paratissierella segnis]|jgi:hypothetical protein|uniref:ABC transporter permease n=1 Tax=Paratissierella segnis TaxID=2763679 RepID=A0A926ILP4_9FIRM|nr:hypothetical protein [Paratissierella segnis]MBC8588868.1 hypothetical protein [Paratissierella segnis]